MKNGKEIKLSVASSIVEILKVSINLRLEMYKCTSLYACNLSFHSFGDKEVYKRR